MTLPDLDFIGVGPRRTGTSWLDMVLRQHGKVALPRYKETFFFDQHFERGAEWYSAWFRDADGKRAGEFGASYFSNPAALERIERCFPDLDHVLVSVREPVERAVSHYRHLRAAGRVPEDITGAISARPEIVRQSQYSVYLPRWISRFGGDRVRLVFLDDVRTRPDVVIRDLLEALGLDPEDGLDTSPANVGSYSLPRVAESLKRRILHGLKRRQWFGLIAMGQTVARNLPPLGSGAPDRDGDDVRRHRDRLQAILREEAEAYVDLRHRAEEAGGAIVSTARLLPEVTGDS